MCVAAMHIAGIGKLYYAASLAQSGEAFEGVSVAARHPIDVEVLRIEAGAALQSRSLPAEQTLAAEAVQILSDWAATRRTRPAG
jgi:tRNA(Arg) A34 adenosine deaminase TadA